MPSCLHPKSRFMIHYHYKDRSFITITCRCLETLRFKVITKFAAVGVSLSCSQNRDKPFFDSFTNKCGSFATYRFFGFLSLQKSTDLKYGCCMFGAISCSSLPSSSGKRDKQIFGAFAIASLEDFFRFAATAWATFFLFASAHTTNRRYSGNVSKKYSIYSGMASLEKNPN